MNIEEIIQVRDQNRINFVFGTIQEHNNKHQCTECGLQIEIIYSDSEDVLYPENCKDKFFVPHAKIHGHEQCLKAATLKETAKTAEVEQAKANEFKKNQTALFLNTIPFEDCVNSKLSEVDHENRALLESWRLNEDVFGFLFRGQVGTGKTYASVAFAKKIAERIINELEPEQEHQNECHPSLPRFIKSSELYEKTQRNEFQIPSKIKSARILFLDDIGSENVTDFKRETLYNLFEYRLSKKLLTFVTTNLSLTQIKDAYFERVSSRLLALCVPIEFKGQDRRMNIAVERRKTLKARAYTGNFADRSFPKEKE